VYTRKDVAQGAAWLGLGIGAWIAIGIVSVVLGTVGSIIAWRAANVTATATAHDRVQVQNLGTNNILEKQNFFFATNEDYKRSLSQIAIYKSNLKSDNHSDGPQFQADKDGLTANRQSCLATVADYNAQSANFNSGQFRSINLPASIDAEACSQ
jgi:hypothetical protein